MALVRPIDSSLTDEHVATSTRFIAIFFLAPSISGRSWLWLGPRRIRPAGLSSAAAHDIAVFVYDYDA
jgi:hypothetical protein